MARLDTLAFALGGGSVVLNAFAYFHARALLTFGSAGEKTKDPEQLSAWERARVLFTGARVPKPRNLQTPSAVGLAYEARMIQVSPGVTLAAWWIANARARGVVLLFHGFTASKEQLLAEAATFHARGFGVLLVDFRGSGESSEQSTSVGYWEAEDVQAAVRYAHAELGAGKPILYGRSMGAAAALRAIALGTEPIAGVIVEGVFDTMLNTVQARFRTMNVPATPFAELLVFWGGAQQGFWGFGHNPVDYARHCSVPALVLHGDRDPRATPDQAHAVFGALAGKKTLTMFPGAVHESLLAHDRPRWEDAVTAFLQQI